jgi:quinol monooxygenase YgiN
MSIVLVTAMVKAKSGKQVALEAMLRSLLTPTHQEPGCILYALHQANEDASTFVFIEKWRSEQDLKKHMYSPHVRKALACREELIEEIRMLRLSSLTAADGPKEYF